MCNLNILLKDTSKLPKSHDTLVTGFMQTVTALSYNGNSDGDGIYFSNGKLAKSTNKLNLLNYKKDIRASDYLISHQRYATSGELKENVQPFHIGDFVLVHNGVVSSYAKGSKNSDTYWLFDAFMKHFNTNKMKGRREKKIYSALKCIFNDVNSKGSYSIALFDIKDGCMYYFKNYSRMITMMESKNYTFLTTSKSNAAYVSMLNEEFKEVDILSNEVYKFNLTKKYINWKTLGKIGTWKTNKGSKKDAKKKLKEDSKPTTAVTKVPNSPMPVLETDFNTHDVDGLEAKIMDDYYNTPLSERVYIDVNGGGACNLCNAETELIDPMVNDLICVECVNEYMKDIHPVRNGTNWDTRSNADYAAMMGEWEL